PDAAFDRTVRRVRGLDLFFKLPDPADRPNETRPALIHDGDAAGIVATILQTFQPIDQYARNFAVADIPHDSAHVTPSSASSSSLTPNDDTNRLQQDQQIESRRDVFGVVQIVFELVMGVLNGRAVRIHDLGPPGDSGLHIVTEIVVPDIAP